MLLVGFQIADVPCLGEGSFPFFVITLLAMQVRIPEEEELDEELEDELNNPGLEKPEEEVTPKVSSRGAGGDEGTPDDVSKNSPEEEEEELDEEVETVLNNLNALILPLPIGLVASVVIGSTFAFSFDLISSVVKAGDFETRRATSPVT